jgi:hypothetical protein
MRAGLRFRTILLAVGAMFAPASALAQDTTQPATTNTPAADTIGPRELQNFSLPGTTTRPADPPATAPATAAPSRRTDIPGAGTPARPRAAAQAPANRRTEREVAAAPATATPAPPAPLGATFPPPTQAVRDRAVQPVSIGSAAADAPVPAEPIVAERKLWIMPWLLAALALVAGVAFLLWHRRPREAYAGGPDLDLFVAPEPAPAPPRAAAPRPAALPPKPVAPSPKSGGIVAARLRPSLELGMQPLRCIVDDAQVTIEFEIELFNAGTAPARAVLAEARLFNAGGAQDQELAAFFANPIAAGEGLDVIEPLKRMTFTSQVVAPRGAIQEYELTGRKTFVPLIAFNAVYEWSGSKGQTSAAYLVGRATDGDKLGPLRLDLGAREFRGLAAHALPNGLKT